MPGVAIIDTGVSLNYFDNVVSLESSIILSDANKVVKGSVPDNIMTHGTVCASIIRTYAPAAPLHSLNVFVRGTANLDSIVKAFQYCIENNIKVINVSFGTNYIKNDISLRNVVNSMSDNGIIVIASVSKNGVATYPAHYSNVISVGVSADLHLSKNRIKVNENASSLINVFACGVHRLYKDKRLTHITANEPSYATAVVTALVHNVLSESNREANSWEVLEILADSETRCD